jgi:hypothetical protein
MSPNCYIIPNNASETDEIMANLATCKAMQYPNITAYLRENVPEPLFYNNNQRITPILVIADLGWSITVRNGYDPADFDNRGNHGYDNKYLLHQNFFSFMIIAIISLIYI